MNARPVFFDLDGTISDPSEGITKSINYALKSLPVEPRPAHRLLRFIGPPLFQIFSELLETDDDRLIMQAVSKFRERYFDVGYKENTLYSGIRKGPISPRKSSIILDSTTCLTVCMAVD